MHDNMTVAFEIRSPFKNKPSRMWPEGYRETLITIWHVDPETDGSDDSCDWFGSKRPLSAKEKALNKAIFAAENIFDNHPHYPDSPEHRWYQTLKKAAREWRKHERAWWQHPKWHVHHWKLQIHPWQDFHRWAFVRCAQCGGRFGWNENVIGNGGGKEIWHFRCHGEVVRAREAKFDAERKAAAK